MSQLAPLPFRQKAQQKAEQIPAQTLSKQTLPAQTAPDQTAANPHPDTADNLLRHPGLWKAGQLRPAGLAVSTGHPELDRQLAGGWPTDAVAEFLFDGQGIGELQLLVPAMRTLSQSQNRWIVWINPPSKPCAPALESLGIDLDKILMIYPRSPKEALWALEKTLQSGGSSMVLAWIDESMLSVRNSRRLQLAARRGHSFCTLFRPSRAEQQPSMAPIRIALRAGGADAVAIDIRKRRGAWPVSGLTVSLSHPPGRQKAQSAAVEEQLARWRKLAVQYPTPGQRPHRSPRHSQSQRRSRFRQPTEGAVITEGSMATAGGIAPTALH